MRSHRPSARARGPAGYAPGRSRPRAALPRELGAGNLAHAAPQTGVGGLHHACRWRPRGIRAGGRSAALQVEASRMKFPLRIRFGRRATNGSLDSGQTGLTADERLFALGTRTLADLVAPAGAEVRRDHLQLDAHYA